MSDLDLSEEDSPRRSPSPFSDCSRQGAHSSPERRSTHSGEDSGRDDRPPDVGEDEPEGNRGSGSVDLCSVHKTNLTQLTIETCNACRIISKMMKPEVLKGMIGKTGSPGPQYNVEEVPTAAARFCWSNEKPLTLTFSESTMTLANKIFTLGKFKINNHFEVS